MPPSILAMILIFFGGVLLTRFRIVTPLHTTGLVKVVFWVSLPATILISLDQIALEAVLWKLPLASVFVVVSLLPLSWWTARLLKLSRPSQGSFLVGTSIINMAFFAYPVFLVTLGPEALGLAVFFDVGHGVLTLTVIYALAVWYGRKGGTHAQAVRRFLSAPPLWALLGMLTLKGSGQHLPSVALSVLTPLHMTTAPLAALVLGLSTDFSALRRNFRVAALAVTIRMGGGLVLGVASAWLLSLKGLEQTVVILSAAMPAGLNGVIFATEEELDTDLSASIVALSICIGLAGLSLWHGTVGSM